jgi:hypothetical protein
MIPSVSLGILFWAVTRNHFEAESWQNFLLCRAAVHADAVTATVAKEPLEE